MKIALIGYGVMGKIIETLAQDDNHEIIEIIDERDAQISATELADKLKGADVAIDFSIAEAVRRNVEACLLAKIPLVEGTTGWNSDLENIKKIVIESEGAFIFGANFSVGVNIFYRIVSQASELFAKFTDYEPYIEEQHHSRKKDAPSGTALKLKALVEEKVNREFSVSSTRAGNIPGTHIVGFDGLADQISLTHIARTREGFASGAIVAAKWIVARKGFWEFTQMMDEVLK
ncbi:MAG TPA: dihydrodipicolinate reductase C-terminal domain-containing protein [Pyrinomonadaceae bacterium]|nr:dihydrodipicolinate reductase C-terminal domain-containing protein [Pyrinomonadaceae bacterium]